MRTASFRERLKHGQRWRHHTIWMEERKVHQFEAATKCGTLKLERLIFDLTEYKVLLWIAKKLYESPYHPQPLNSNFVSDTTYERLSIQKQQEKIQQQHKQLEENDKLLHQQTSMHCNWSNWTPLIEPLKCDTFLMWLLTQGTDCIAYVLTPEMRTPCYCVLQMLGLATTVLLPMQILP